MKSISVLSLVAIGQLFQFGECIRWGSGWNLFGKRHTSKHQFAVTGTLNGNPAPIESYFGVYSCELNEGSKLMATEFDHGKTDGITVTIEANDSITDLYRLTCRGKGGCKLETEKSDTTTAAWDDHTGVLTVSATTSSSESGGSNDEANSPQVPFSFEFKDLKHNFSAGGHPKHGHPSHGL